MNHINAPSIRQFLKDEHIRNIQSGDWVDLFDEFGNQLKGIRGRMGAAGLTLNGNEIGVDLIEMKPGAAFPLHSHPGDHILFVISGSGIVHIDGIDYAIDTEDSIFIPAEYPHGVRFDGCSSSSVFQFLAFGYPHKHLSAKDRMKLAKELQK